MLDSYIEEGKKRVLRWDDEDEKVVIGELVLYEKYGT